MVECVAELANQGDDEVIASCLGFIHGIAHVRGINHEKIPYFGDELRRRLARKRGKKQVVQREQPTQKDESL